jgi:hypothetical protein
MDEVLTTTLCEAVYERLDYLGRLVNEADLRSRAALADTEIVRMTQAWRALLGQHEPNLRGRCPRCSRWRRPAPFPCSVWAVAHHYLITGAPAGRRTVTGGRTQAAP